MMTSTRNALDTGLRSSIYPSAPMTRIAENHGKKLCFVGSLFCGSPLGEKSFCNCAHSSFCVPRTPATTKTTPTIMKTKATPFIPSQNTVRVLSNQLMLSLTSPFFQPQKHESPAFGLALILAFECPSQKPEKFLFHLSTFQNTVRVLSYSNDFPVDRNLSPYGDEYEETYQQPGGNDASLAHLILQSAKFSQFPIRILFAM